MNTRRIVLGGLVAGAILAAGEGVVRLVGAAGAVPTGTMPFAVLLVRFAVLGMFCMLFYAAAIPTLGAGPRAAATVGLLVFIVGVAFPPFAWATAMGHSGDVLLNSVIANAVTLPIAVMAGAWLYGARFTRTAGAAGCT